MLARVLAVEDGKDLLQRTQSKTSSLRIFKVFLMFLCLGVVASVLGMYSTRYFDVKNLILQPPMSLIQPCVEEGNGLDRWIRPPSNLTHSMSDEELLWRASFVPKLRKYPYKRVPKVAFMFLTRGPLPLSPLWEKFFKGQGERFSIYIHSLPNYEPEFPPSSVFYRRQIPSQVLLGLYYDSTHRFLMTYSVYGQ